MFTCLPSSTFVISVFYFMSSVVNLSFVLLSFIEVGKLCYFECSKNAIFQTPFHCPKGVYHVIPPLCTRLLQMQGTFKCRLWMIFVSMPWNSVPQLNSTPIGRFHVCKCQLMQPLSGGQKHADSRSCTKAMWCMAQCSLNLTF